MKYKGKYSLKKYLFEKASPGNFDSSDLKEAFKWIMSKNAAAQIWEWVIAEQSDSQGNHVVSVSGGGDTVTFTHPNGSDSIGPTPAALVVFPEGGFLTLVKKMRDLLSLSKGEVFFPGADTAHSDIVVKTSDGIKEYHAKWNMSDSGRFVGVTRETAKAMKGREKPDHNPTLSDVTSGGYLPPDMQDEFYDAINGVIQGSDQTTHQELVNIRNLSATDLANLPTTNPKDRDIILNTDGSSKENVKASKRAQQRSVRSAVVQWLTSNTTWLEKYFNKRFGESEDRQNILLSGKMSSPSDEGSLKIQVIDSSVGTKIFGAAQNVTFDEVPSTTTTISVCLNGQSCFDLEVRAKEKNDDLSGVPLEFKGGRALQVTDVNYGPESFGVDWEQRVEEEEDSDREEFLRRRRYETSHPPTLGKLFEWAVKQ